MNDNKEVSGMPISDLLPEKTFIEIFNRTIPIESAIFQKGNLYLKANEKYLGLVPGEELIIQKTGRCSIAGESNGHILIKCSH